jgi:uroporphyrinogen-III synthase
MNRFYFGACRVQVPTARSSYNSDMGFDGLRVLALESRRAVEMGTLISKAGGLGFVAPSMREVALADNSEALSIAGRVVACEFEMAICLTGVGMRQWDRLVVPRIGEAAWRAALGRLTLVARGPKPVAALREMGLQAAVVAAAPNTWREVVAAVEGRAEKRIVVQEYGRSNVEMLAALRDRGAEVTPVRVYGWDLPEDLEPLKEAARRLAAREFDVALFTTAVQIVHLAQVAREMGMEAAALDGLRRCRVCSIGPSTTELLEEYGVPVAMEPSQAKMGLLVREAAEGAGL